MAAFPVHPPECPHTLFQGKWHEGFRSICAFCKPHLKAEEAGFNRQHRLPGPAFSCWLHFLIWWWLLMPSPDCPHVRSQLSALLPWTWPVSRAPAWCWPLLWWERTTRTGSSSSDVLGIHTLGAMSCMIIPMPSSILLLLPSSCYTCPYWIFKLKK